MDSDITFPTRRMVPKNIDFKEDGERVADSIKRKSREMNIGTFD